MAPAREDAVPDVGDGRLFESVGSVWEDRAAGFSAVRPYDTREGQGSAKGRRDGVLLLAGRPEGRLWRRGRLGPCVY